MMALQMPKLPTAEEIRSMSKSKYDAFLDSLYILCYEALGASSSVICDCHYIRENNPEVRAYLDEINDYYCSLINDINNALDWMFKIRYGIK